MTDEQLQGLRELEQAATKGPWSVGVGGIESCYRGDHVILAKVGVPCHHSLTMCVLMHGNRNFPGDAKANAALTTAARNALPDLLDEIERLRKREAKMETVIQKYGIDSLATLRVKFQVLRDYVTPDCLNVVDWAVHDIEQDASALRSVLHNHA